MSLSRLATLMLASVCIPAAGAAARERAAVAAAAPPGQIVSFDVFVPPAPNPALDSLVAAQTDPNSPQFHHWLTPAQYRDRFGTSPAALSDVAGEMRAAGFVIERVSAHAVRVSGPVANVNAEFATRLHDGFLRSGRHLMVAENALHLPAALARHHALVPAFDPVVRRRVHSASSGPILHPDNRSGRTGPYWVTDLKQAYDWPDVRALDAKGVTIGILVPGDYNPPDMKAYFGHEKLPVPKITVRSINGGAAYSATGSEETHLDIQQSAGMATGADVVLYNLPDLTDGSILSGLLDIDDRDEVDIVNMSFGGPELFYAASYNGGVDYFDELRAIDTLFRQGNTLGISFVASSGDDGALDAPPLACLASDATSSCGAFLRSVEHPASSPYVTGVGGTNLITRHDAANPKNLDSGYVAEIAYYDRLTGDAFYGTPASGAIWGSGGGVSFFEPQPDWQNLAPTGTRAHRTVPDVALHMGGCIDLSVLPCGPDRSSDATIIGGRTIALHGTSASSPDFVGLLALKVSHEGSRLGNANPDIYARGHLQRLGRISRVFRDGISGNNGLYPATRGYNLVLGNGTPLGRAFIGVPDLPPAGVPQTPSNP